jgi:hypothetical protein
VDHSDRSELKENVQLNVSPISVQAETFHMLRFSLNDSLPENNEFMLVIADTFIINSYVLSFSTVTFHRKSYSNERANLG